MQKPNVFVDTSLLVRSLIARDKGLENLLYKYLKGELILSSGLGVLEETYYKLISLVTRAFTGKTGVHAVKQEWKRNEDISKNVKTRFDILLELIDIGVIFIVPTTMPIFKRSYEISREYGLFPNDALIVATCEAYEIKKIATYDKDFEKVDFLEIFVP
jgi:predicted nucleic acid-binding protein